MPAPAREQLIEAIDELGAVAAGGAPALAPHAHSPAFLGLRALVVEAYYSDYVAPGSDAPGAWAEIGFDPPAAAFLRKDWSYLGLESMSERFDVVVVGSGAGGGVVAGELAARGRRVALLELGPHRTARDFRRWEAHASHDLWWPIRFAMPAGEWGPGPVALIGGRCVGGSTTINTKVAMRADADDLGKWHAASGLLGDGGEPFARGATSSPTTTASSAT